MSEFLGHLAFDMAFRYLVGIRKTTGTNNLTRHPTRVQNLIDPHEARVNPYLAFWTLPVLALRLE